MSNNDYQDCYKVAVMNTHDLVNHHEHSQLRMLGALGITIYCNTQPLIELAVCAVTISGGYAVRILRFGIEQE